MKKPDYDIYKKPIFEDVNVDDMWRVKRVKLPGEKRYRVKGPGGLSWKRFMELLNQYEYGDFNKSAIHGLMLEWKSLANESGYWQEKEVLKIVDLAGTEDVKSLRELTLLYFIPAIINNDVEFFKEAAQIAEYFKNNEPFIGDPEEKDLPSGNEPDSTIQIKRAILLYLAKNYKPKYTIREIYNFIKDNIHHVTRRSISNYCKEMGIRIDSTRGRPRKK